VPQARGKNSQHRPWRGEKLHPFQLKQFRKTRQVTSDRHLKYKSAGYFNLPDGFCSIAN